MIMNLLNLASIPIRLFTCLILLICFTNWVFVFAQGSDKIPLPEYFGIYAVEKGQLYAVKDGKTTNQAPTHNIQLYSIAKGTSQSYPAFVFPSDIKFLVFQPDTSSYIQGLTLIKLPFVSRNLGSGMNNSINEWIAARVPKFSIQLLSKPVAAQSLMIQAIPQSDLQPGFYALYYQNPNQLRAQVWWTFLEIKSSEQPNRTDCIDILFQTGGVLGGMEMSDYFMRYGPADFPIITEQKYRACDPRVAISNKESDPSPRLGESATPSVGPNCNTFDGCMDSGLKAVRSQNWEQASANFTRASSIEPLDPRVWSALGAINLIKGNNEEAM